MPGFVAASERRPNPEESMKTASSKHAPILVVAALGLVTAAGPAESGLPCFLPERCGFGISPPAAGCQYRFDAAGGLDELSIAVTLRDCFDSPVAGCDISATLAPNAETDALCGCSPLRQMEVSDAAGTCEYSFSGLGGRGSLDITLTVHCIGDIEIFRQAIQFTTPDLDGSCEPPPASSTGVIDLGLWAWGLSDDLPHSDFDCSGDVGIVDLGIWASGLLAGCE
jgi:hypothetical protein